MARLRIKVQWASDFTAFDSPKIYKLIFHSSKWGNSERQQFVGALKIYSAKMTSTKMKQIDALTVSGG